MKVKANNGTFEPCPEYTGKAVCVDVTPLRKQSSPFGDRDVFKLVFEVDLPRGDGSRFCAWSRNFTPTLNEKSNFRKFLRGWFGHDLAKAELDEFDTESLIGKAAQIVVVQQHKDGEIYANIVACTPDKSPEALPASGKYVRVKDRPPKDGPGVGSQGAGQSGGYRRAQPATGEASEYSSVKVHVGRCKGLELRDLAPDQIEALFQYWLPTVKTNPKPTADDKRLIAALEWLVPTKPADDDNVPY